LYHRIIGFLNSYFSHFEYERAMKNVRKLLLPNFNNLLHIGASVGQEAEEYESLGLSVIWVEAIPSIHAKLLKNISKFPNQVSILALLGEVHEKEVLLHLYGKDFMSSSIFELSDDFPGFEIDSHNSIKLRTQRLDEILEMRKQIEACEYWVLDVQGQELSVLKGALGVIGSCKVIELECSSYSIYKKAPLYNEVKLFLEQLGFFPIMEPPVKFHSNVIFFKHK
jgi:FkbM family methyltransferase